MASATLRGGNASVIELKMNNSTGASDRVYIAVNFIDSSTGTPTGKRVNLGTLNGTAEILGWTNATPLPEGYRQLPSGATEYTRHKIAAGSVMFLISTLKAANPGGVFEPHPADSEATIITDAPHGDDDHARRLQVKQWKFTNGGNGDQVIITIVMIDDEGGGDEPFLHLRVGRELFKIEAHRVTKR